MASEYRRGFKKQAEELALEIRAALGLGPSDKLDPRALAAEVDVPVFELEELERVGMSATSIRHLLHDGRREFSAALFERGGSRLIVANPSHSLGRQANNIVHEVSHLLLKHKPPDDVIEGGCRRWDPMMEKEADWQAGELLVPRCAALQIAREEMDPKVAAQHFGVSVAMMNWRLNHSGARIQARRERAAGARRGL